MPQDSGAMGEAMPGEIGVAISRGEEMLKVEG